ncbi:MAG: PAS domain-containing protein [Pseudomonadota bacterium]|nr:PAS domain-containing protein [Pseudomonadota bacterium]
MEALDKNSTATVVVGVGASAGGVEALSAFFDQEQGGSKAAFLVAMHLAPGRQSHLPDILSRHTSMRVVQAEDGMLLAPDSVYVLSPSTVMTVNEHTLRVLPSAPSERGPTVIDRMFNSMAEVFGERAIGIVLSGTGDDGALGLRAIKECGGLTIAQVEDGTAPLFSGMPQSAIAAGAIDDQLSVEQIGARLDSAIKMLGGEPSPSDGPEAEHQNELRKEICALIHAQTGHDFSGYKPSTFMRRVARRMNVLQLNSLEDCVEYLKQTPMEVTELFRDLLISVTSFFRDSESFDSLEQTIVPAMFEGKLRAEEVRVWIPGCATGEEAYSVGILLLEHAERLGTAAPAIRIFATDIDEHALSIARKGRYPSALMKSVSEERRNQFFVDDCGHFTVQKRLREICTFSLHNALRDPPFSRIDLVSCRNLLIYLGQEFQDRILPITHYALRHNGFLFLGVAEGISRNTSLFKPISKEGRIFQRLHDPDGSGALPLLKSGLHTRTTQRSSAPLFTPPIASNGSSLRHQIEARILDAHTPAYVLVNGQGEAMFYSGRTSDYLEFPAGMPNRHLLSNARKELRLGLRHALHEAVTLQQRVELPDTTIDCGGALRRVQVSIEPFKHGDTPLYLVLFSDRGAAPHLAQNFDEATAHNVEQLERELTDTREQLQSTHEEFETAIEELRVSNEELMSVNEELQSSNEELETSKEELQSINEELQTVNSEMARHADALDQSNAELSGLLENNGIATIFLDPKLAIRRYTQAATDIFTLIPSDCGRLITDLTSQLKDFDPRELLETAMETRQVIEEPLTRKNERKHYLMRILPYIAKTPDNSGVVMTFIDVTALAQADARHKSMIGELNHRVRNMLAIVSAMANQTLMQSVESEALDAFLDRLHAMARTYKLLTETDWSYMSFTELLRGELSVIAKPSRYSISGPPLKLEPREALALGMVVHELATNALKYGALSNDSGRVDVTWARSEESAFSTEICWKETGGPQVAEPKRRGFGSLMIERQLSYELSGHSNITYTPEGLEVKMQLPRLHPQPKLESDHLQA